MEREREREGREQTALFPASCSSFWLRTVRAHSQVNYADRQSDRVYAAIVSLAEIMIHEENGAAYRLELPLDGSTTRQRSKLY